MSCQEFPCPGSRPPLSRHQPLTRHRLQITGPGQRLQLGQMLLDLSLIVVGSLVGEQEAAEA